MNITVQSLRPLERLYTRSEVLLAAKLEAAATGTFPQRPKSLYLIQARALGENPSLAQSIVASLTHIMETRR